MKIYRNGAEIELTKRELMDAAKEYQHLCDVEDIKAIADFHTNEEEFIEAYGINFAVLNEIAERCAVRYRRYMDEYGNWFDNAIGAIRDVVIELGLSE